MTQQKLIEHITFHFEETFNQKPLLVFSPGRINLIGEHTDYNDGFVFPAAIDKGIVAAISKSNDDFCSITALDVNEALKFTFNDIVPKENGSWENYVLGVVYEIKKTGKQIGNFNLVFAGDIPGGAGLSSSAALENSVAFGLNTLFQLGLSKEEMIFISQRAEHNFVGVKCGIMDQYASMFGQKNKALLLDCRTIKATEYEIDFKDYQLLLINTNIKHTLSESAYNNRRSTCEKIASMLKVKALRDVNIEDLDTIKDKLNIEEYLQASYIIHENNRVLKASEALNNNDLDSLGNLLFASHNGLKNCYEVSCEELNFLVDKAKDNPNIIGARMMGGGFGGCTLNLIRKSAIEEFSTSISVSYKEQFNVDCNIYNVQISKGTHLINS